MMPGRHAPPGAAVSLALLLLILLGPAALGIFTGCALVYIASAPNLQQISAGNPHCVAACSTTATSGDADPAASAPAERRPRRDREGRQ